MLCRMFDWFSKERNAKKMDPKRFRYPYCRKPKNGKVKKKGNETTENVQDSRQFFFSDLIFTWHEIVTHTIKEKTEAREEILQEEKCTAVN